MIQRERRVRADWESEKDRPGPPGSPAPSVLVIEDDPPAAALYEDLLGEAGFAVTVLQSAVGAAKLVRQGPRPSAIVLDLGLPYLSGARLLRELKDDPATAPLPVVIVSAMTDVLTPDLRDLAASVVVKPFDSDSFLAALSRIVTGARVSPS